MKCRIIKRICVDNRVCYVIQQKGWLLGWRDAWLNSLCGASCTDSFSTLKEAEKNLCYFDDSVCKEEVILTKE